MVDISTDHFLIDNLLSGSYTDYETSQVTTLTSCIQQLPSNDAVAELGDAGVSGTAGAFAISRYKLPTYPKMNSKLTVAGKDWRIVKVNLRVLNQTYICVCVLHADVELA